MYRAFYSMFRDVLRFWNINFLECNNTKFSKVLIAALQAHVQSTCEMYMYGYILLTSNRLLHSERFYHRLNMELDADLRSLFGLHVMWWPQPYSLAETPHPPSPYPPVFGLVYEGAIGQPRYISFFMTPPGLTISFCFVHYLLSPSLNWMFPRYKIFSSPIY